MLLLLLFPTSPPTGAADLDARRAEEFLRREKGLWPIPGGNIWLSDTERRVREHLAGLDDTKRQILELQKSLDERVQQNYVTWESSRQRITALKAALPSAKKDTEKKQVEQQIKDLETAAIEPSRLAAEPNVRTALIKLTNARHRLALAVLSIRRLVPQIESEYQQWQQIPEVQRALRTLGEAHRLGPVGDGYRSVLKKLEEYERLVFTSWVPVYLESGSVRAGLILNETAPITATWRTSYGPTVFTTSMVEAAGLAPATRGETEPIALPPGRRLLARRITVPSIRMGGLVLRDLPALVLPPEGEDLGAQISVDALANHTARVEIEKLRLVIDPK